MGQVPPNAMPTRGVRTAREVIKKVPAEVIIRNLDFGDLLSSGETVSTVSSSSVTPSGELSINSTSVSGSQVQFTLSAGTAGKRYKVFAEVSTSSSQTLDGAFFVEVREV